MPAELSHHTLFALEVVDDAGYALYRAGMTPILTSYGGTFSYDFADARTLKSPVDAPLNRIFVLSFPSEDHARRFFADEAYGAVRAEHFTSSVGHVHRIAQLPELAEAG